MLNRETDQQNVVAEIHGMTNFMKQAHIHVMLVEDSPLIRQALTEALAASGIARFDGFASTAQEAIAILRARHFDMVVVDIELAHGTGFDVLHDINKADFPYAPPIRMVLTNNAYVIYRHRSHALGVKYFFDKSMHFDEAIEAIEKEARRLLLEKAGE